MEELLETVLEAVRAHVRDGHVAPGTPLMEAGVNSLSAVQLARQLEQRTGVSLPPTLVFQYSTAEAIARHLHSELQPALREQEPCMRSQDDVPAHHLHVAVANTAARWPGGASSDRELARLAAAAHNAVGEVPNARWLVPNEVRHSAVRFVAHMQNVELFDSGCFAISPAEALWMDPQQRVLLEIGYVALHNGARGRSSLMAHEVGVVVGIQANDFATIAMNTPTVALPVYAVSGSTFSVAAGRLSYVLGMQVRRICSRPPFQTIANPATFLPSPLRVRATIPIRRARRRWSPRTRPRRWYAVSSATARLSSRST